jgi:hypothetical protein
VLIDKCRTKNRAIGEILGVDHVTVIGNKADENAPPKPNKNNNIDQDAGENSLLDAVAALAADEKLRTEAKSRFTDHFSEFGVVLASLLVSR